MLVLSPRLRLFVLLSAFSLCAPRSLRLAGLEESRGDAPETETDSARDGQAAPAVDGACAVCDGRRTLTCPKCQGERRGCRDCGGSRRSPCEACQGKGQTACARCDGVPKRSCTACSGKGQIFVPQRKVYRKEGGRTVARYIPKYWERCLTCEGDGEMVCGLCRGRGSRACGDCLGTGKVVCAACSGGGGGTCAACHGTGAIDCPRCLKDRERAPAAAHRGAEAGSVPLTLLRDLHWAREILGERPLAKPLLALAHLGRLKEPLAIAVFRDALEEDHRWVRAVALHELAAWDTGTLVKVGGRELAAALQGCARRERGALAAGAAQLLSRMRGSPDGGAERTIDGLPPGRGLPPLPPAESSATEGAGRAAPAARQGRTTVGGGPPAGSQAANELHFGAEELARKGIDLIWTIDTSGSMRRPFAGIQRLLAQATTVLDGLFSDLRVGMVAYRDAVEASLPLADDPKRVLRALEQLVPGQGSGVPEGVDAGLRAALDARLMGWRKASAVAVVVVGDAGPPEPRATALLERVKGLRAEDRRLVVHAVQLEAALHYEAAVGPFWTRLAQAGGGALIRPQAEQEAIERLCLAIPAGIDREVFARVLRAIGKVEDWKLEVPGLSPLPDGGVAGGERDTFVPPKRAGGSP